MKGTIQYCLEEAIIKNFGEKKWEQCLKLSGYPTGFSFMTMIREDIDEEKSINIFVKSAETLGISLTELFDLFGIYWCVEYAPKIYGAFFAGIKSTKSAISKLDQVHVMVTKNIPNSSPPRFNYHWINDDELELTYISKRGLIDLFISLVKGLNKAFDDTCKITKLSQEKMIIDFGDGITQTEFVDETSRN